MLGDVVIRGSKNGSRDDFLAFLFFLALNWGILIRLRALWLSLYPPRGSPKLPPKVGVVVAINGQREGPEWLPLKWYK